jgi:hypothetical protein
MKQRYLPLTAQNLEAPIPPDLDAIIAVMTWPGSNGNEKLMRSLATSRAEYLQRVHELTREESLELVDFAMRTTPLDQIRDETKALLVTGFRSGHYLRAAIFEPEVPMKVHAHEVASFTIFGPSEKIEAKTFANQWPIHRPVSHLWAATIDFYVTNADGSFPCRTDQLVDFLGLSEGYRWRGERTRLKQSRHTILNQGEAIAVHPALKVKPLIPFQMG